jgi:hypothetical protein
LNGTINNKLILNADNGVGSIEWYVDASLVVHLDFKSYMGAIMKFEGSRGSVESTSSKQKLNTSSLTMAELVAVDDALPMVLWTPLFLEAPGYGVYSYTVYQDNKSAILLEENRKKSSGWCMHVLNV